MNIFVYILMTISVVLAFVSQGRKTAIDNNNGVTIYKYTHFNKNLFLLSFLILGAICFLCKSGTDILGYIYNYSHWDWASLTDLSREPGYKIVNILLSKIIPNPYIGIGVIKLFSLGMVFYSAYVVREKISVGMAIYSYCCLLYIYSFQLLRLMMALGIVFLALSAEMKENTKKCIILLVLSFFFHYTSIFVLLAYAGIKILGKKMTIFKGCAVGVVLVILFRNSIYLIEKLQSDVIFFQKYEAYTRNISGYSGIGGIGQLVLFIPIFIILALNYQNEHLYKEYSFHFIFGLMTFACGSLGYLLPNTRMVYYFYYFFFYYCAALPLKFDRYHFKVGKLLDVECKTLLIFSYLLLRFILYLSTGGIQSNGLVEYQFIWS